jgi:hypothetical protein
VGKLQGEGETTWKTRRRWEGVTDVKQEIGSGGDWIYLAREKQVAGSCEHGNEQSGTVNARNFLPSYRTVGLRRTAPYS